MWCGVTVDTPTNPFETVCMTCSYSISLSYPDDQSGGLWGPIPRHDTCIDTKPTWGTCFFCCQTRLCRNDRILKSKSFAWQPEEPFVPEVRMRQLWKIRFVVTTAQITLWKYIAGNLRPRYCCRGLRQNRQAQKCCEWRQDDVRKTQVKRRKSIFHNKLWSRSISENRDRIFSVSDWSPQRSCIALLCRTCCRVQK